MFNVGDELKIINKIKGRSANSFINKEKILNLSPTSGHLMKSDLIMDKLNVLKKK